MDFTVSSPDYRLTLPSHLKPVLICRPRDCSGHWSGVGPWQDRVAWCWRWPTTACVIDSATRSEVADHRLPREHRRHAVNRWVEQPVPQFPSFCKWKKSVTGWRVTCFGQANGNATKYKHYRHGRRHVLKSGTTKEKRRIWGRISPIRTKSNHFGLYMYVVNFPLKIESLFQR